MTDYQTKLRENLRQRYEKKKILVLGFGREGQTTYHFLRRLLPNQHLWIMDANEMKAEQPIFWSEGENGYDSKVSLLYGEHYLQNLNDFDMVFKTPGLPAFLLGDLEKEKITSQTNEFVAAIGEKVIGITGTKGKSTTSSLVSESLKALGKDVTLVGNIGKPALELLLEDEEEKLYVYEMSSHQTQFLRFVPRVAVVLNLFEEHLDNYIDYADYIEAKLNIGKALFENPDKKSLFIHGCDNAKLMEYRERWQHCRHAAFGHLEKNEFAENGIFIEENQIVSFLATGEKTILTDKHFPRKLLGEHNLVNALVAFLVVQELEGLNADNVESTCKAIGAFEGLAHRLEYFGDYRGIAFYDDSISTIPAAVMEAIHSIEKLQTLIIGGFDRGISYDQFVRDLNNHPELHLICLPDTGHKLFPEFCHKVKFQAGDMTEAVELAYRLTDRGRACVLSPAAASYGFYQNFEERGSDFKEKVRAFSKVGKKYEE